MGKWEIRRISQGRTATGFSTARFSPQTKLLQTNKSQRTVWTNPIVVDPPGLNAAAGVCQIDKPVYVEACISELAVEALRQRILDRLSGLDVAQLDSSPPGGLPPASGPLGQ